ncbi:MAG: glycosyltransferase family 39 protein [Candidatus Roizmanbacteria bacterium]
MTVSTFFIKTSFFASNNTLTPLFILLFIYSLYQLFNKKTWQYLFLIGISLGFVLETEMALGFFIIPSFFISSLFFKEIRFLFKKVNNLISIIVGLFIPTIPRILFEIKNNFSQSNSFLDYLTSPKNTHPVQFKGLIQERIIIFWQNWQSIFYNENYLLALIFLSILLVVLIPNKQKNYPKKISAHFLILLLFLVFVFTLLNKNNFFWSYYLDGIQYMFLFLIITAYYILEKTKKLRIFSYLILLSVIVINLFVVINEFTTKKTIPLIGLRADDAIVKYVLQKSQKKDFCLRIYTPPVFPFTYRYLMNYYIKKWNYKIPTDQPINNRCWYIIDYDEDKERIADWIKKNIPDNGKLIEKKFMENKTRIELWSINN